MIEGEELENRQVSRRPQRAKSGLDPSETPAADRGGMPSATPETAWRGISEEELRRRIERANALKPDRGVHCGHCWGKGRVDVLRIIEGGE